MEKAQLTHSTQKIFLAPMEGVVDWVVRDIYSRLGGLDYCVTEFIRVTDKVLPPHVYHREAPELLTRSMTRAQTPMLVQLLGGQPGPLAENARLVCELGAYGIDLNFGCPAKTVNRHDGGASLLQYPERIFEIVKAVRQAVPAEISVSAKMRLGFADTSLCLENASAMESAGASWLTVHCRTKTDGYKPPAYWEWLPKIREAVSIPVVGNGEIWTAKDYHECVRQSGCTNIMIGRGAISDPFLIPEIKGLVDFDEHERWLRVRALLPAFFKSATEFKSEFFAQARTKQWLKQLALRYPQAKAVFEELKVITKPAEFSRALTNSLTTEPGAEHIAAL